MKLWRGLRALTLPALGLDGKKVGLPGVAFGVGVGVLVGFLQSAGADVGVDLGRCQALVAEQFLNAAEVRPAVEEVGRERMT